MNTLISNVTVVTMNEKMDVLFGAYVGIDEGKISYLSKTAPEEQPQQAKPAGNNRRRKARRAKAPQDKQAVQQPKNEQPQSQEDAPAKKPRRRPNHRRHRPRPQGPQNGGTE